MKVSIIMLTYNREMMLNRMIESVLSQTLCDFEYIIVDNGSTDKSGIIADEYASKDNRIKVIHKARGNIGSGRNAGVNASTGDYLAFVDDDDYLEPEYLEYLYNLACKNEADISICGSWREINGEREAKYIFDGIYTYTNEEAVMEMIKRQKFNAATPTKLITRRLAQKVRFSDTAKYDDVEWTYKIFALSKKTVVSGVPLYTFIRHNKNNSKGTTVGERVDTEQIKVYLELFRERTKWLTEYFPNCSDFWLYSELSYVISMYEKTEGSLMHIEIEKILKKNIKTFLTMNQYYSERDKMLVEKYGGILNES